jgi:glycosyltransferase involved in cell wall biosynthesis
MCREILDRYLPEAAKIYDAEALFSRRLEMQAERFPDSTRKADVAAMKELETSIVRWTDRVVCISSLEADVVRSMTPNPVHVVSSRLELAQPTDAGFHERSGIGFVAGWMAGPGAPNSDGLLWFGREVLPKVLARRPEAVLHVTGFNPPEDVQWLASPHIEFVGEIRDLSSFYRKIRVAISPSRFGAGVKIKSVEAIQFAVPLVCTSEAASGLPPPLRAAVWVADCPDDFAEAVAELLTNDRAWNRMRDGCLAAEHPTPSEENDPLTSTWPAIVRDCVRARKEEV